MKMEFSQCAHNYTGDFKDFCPFSAVKDGSICKLLPSKIVQNIIAEGEHYLNFSYPVIQASDYMAFKRTGNRVDFESVYFTRRHALNALVLAECVERKGRFTDDIINGIFCICEESGWQLPPHNSYERNAPQYILPDVSKPVLDLFSCETGAMLACVLYLLEETLDNVSPLICGRIRLELNHRILSPYMNTHFWWQGNEAEEMCNWTVWCTQNVLLTAFLSGKENLHEIFEKAALSCDYFLKDYGEDGCCDEGAQYYRHAGLCLFGCLEILNAVSDNSFSHFYKQEKIKNIAAYILNVHIDGEYYFNFADCSPIAGRAGVREYLFGKATSQPDLMRFAAKDFQAADGPLYTDEVNRINLFYRMQTLFFYNDVMHFDTAAPIVTKDIFYKSVGLFISRNETFALAVKAGDNNDSHNHNDTGSFTLYKNGSPLFADIGVESYTAKTFSDKRYEIWTMQSGYHNLPTIAGTDELAGAAYCAANIILSEDSAVPSISMELSAAYPKENLPCTFYNRKIDFHKQENRIILTDSTDCKNVILNFITYEKPECNGNILRIGALGSASFSGAALKCIETLPILDKRLQTAWKHDLYRVRLTLTGDMFKMIVE